MTDIDIVERLRISDDTEEINAERREAADEIERLRAENDILRGKIIGQSWSSELPADALEPTEIERLKRAEIAWHLAEAEIERLRARWQPIKTAPTDGTKFLAITCEGRMRVDWLDVTLSTSQHFRERGDDPYTHWMPLPKPPPIGE